MLTTASVCCSKAPSSSEIQPLTVARIMPESFFSSRSRRSSSARRNRRSGSPPTDRVNRDRLLTARAPCVRHWKGGAARSYGQRGGDGLPSSPATGAAEGGIYYWCWCWCWRHMLVHVVAAHDPCIA